MIYICILYNFVFIYHRLSLTSSIHSITFLLGSNVWCTLSRFLHIYGVRINCADAEGRTVAKSLHVWRKHIMSKLKPSRFLEIFFEDDVKSPGMNSSGQPFTWQRRTMMSMAFAAYWSGVLMSTFATTRSARPSTWLLWVDIRRWIYGENGWYRIPGDLVLVEVPK